jgi:putative ABC transport system substrate-binding protein
MVRNYHRRLVLLMALALAGCGGRPNTTANGTRRVGLVYIGPHELINQIVLGFRERLGKGDADHPIEIVERHANGDQTQISSTINGAIANHLDVLATITTPVSQQALKNAPQGLPVVFVGVTDPVGAGLVKVLEKPELTSGVSDIAPLPALLAVIKQITPTVKRIGFPYSPDEEPALYSRRQVEALAPTLGYVVDARPVTSKDELPTLLRDMVRTNDAILVGADNAMFEAAPLIAKTALDGHKPFYAADSSSVKAGAIAGVTVDYTAIGRAGAEVVARVLKGEAVGTIPVRTMSEGMLEVNQTSLGKLSITLSPEVAKKVKATYH